MLLPLATTIKFLSWNVHWQTGGNYNYDAEYGTVHNAATAKYMELQRNANASVVVAIELETIDGNFYNLSQNLTDWTTVGYTCTRTWTDSISMSFAPHYTVLDSKGGCSVQNANDARALVAARVTSQQDIRGCSAGLCFVALHGPHPQTLNANTYLYDDNNALSVCAGIAQSCTIAVGDWNMASHTGSFPAACPGSFAQSQSVYDGFYTLTNTQPSQTLVVPDNFVCDSTYTCCYNWDSSSDPSRAYGDGMYDHLALNIPNATVNYTILPYQFNRAEEHNPMLYDVQLPTTSPTASFTASPTASPTADVLSNSSSKWAANYIAAIVTGVLTVALLTIC